MLSEDETYMNSLMRPQIATFGKTSVTFIAFVRFLACMSSHVYFQCAGTHKFIATLFTDIRSLTRVPSLMIGQMTLSGEAHLTISEVTLEGFQSVVYPHMSE